MVEHSPSTVIALNVSPAASRSARSSSPFGTAASVVTKPSIVASMGSIIPDPFAMPPIVTSRPSMTTCAAASLGNGSVVMIARAAIAPWSAPRAPKATGNPPRILSIGSATPMTPVDATRTCSAGQWTSRAVSAAMSRAACMPSSPVHAFAQPLLTMTARAMPPERARCSRDTTTGAASARLVVNTAAACAGPSQTSSARSSPPLALMPALTPAARKPRGVVTPPEMAETVAAIYASGAAAAAGSP